MLYQCLAKACWRKMPDGVTNKLYHKGDYEDFKSDQEAGNHFLNIDSPKQVQAGKREVLLEELKKELKSLTRTSRKTLLGKMPMSPDLATKKRIAELKKEIAQLKPAKKKEEIANSEPSKEK